MKKELEEKLFEKYPNIFKQKDLPPTKSLMCFGFEHGDGWYFLLDKLCEFLQSSIDNNKKYKGSEKFPQVEAVQVKEKLGSLRFYTTDASNFFNGAIAFAEYISKDFCEHCGSTEKTYNNPDYLWIRYLCRKCHRKENRKRIKKYRRFWWEFISIPITDLIQKIKKLLRK